MIKRTVAVLSLLVVCAATPGAAAAAAEPWRDPGQPPLTRADELLAALSFDQKVDIAMGQLTPWPASASRRSPPATGRAACARPAPPACRRRRRSPRRSIARLAHAYGQAIAQEVRGKGFNAWLGPAMDIARTPLAGRQPENLGEDPFLAGHTVAAEVRGVKSGHAMETLKHYVANNQEWQRTGSRPSRTATTARRSTQSSRSARCRRSMRRRSAPRFSAAAPTASCAPTTASTGRRPARARRSSTTSSTTGLQRVRRPRLHVRRARRPGGRQRGRRLPRAARATSPADCARGRCSRRARSGRPPR